MHAANVLAFAETCLRPTDRSTDYQLMGFDLYQNDDFWKGHMFELLNIVHFLRMYLK